MGIHLLLGALKAGSIALKCPHCGEVQLRARRPRGQDVRCRNCHKLFRREEGETKQRPPGHDSDRSG